MIFGKGAGLLVSWCLHRLEACATRAWLAACGPI